MPKKQIKITLICDEYYVADSLHDLASFVEESDFENYTNLNELQGSHYTAKIEEIIPKNKVYTLLRTSSSRGERTTNVRVFSELENAKKQMDKEYAAELADWKSWCDTASLKTENDKMSKCIYEDGYYDDNHIDWLVEEQVVN